MGKLWTANQKSDGDENMIRVHKLINANDALVATAWLNETKKYFDCNKNPIEIFSIQKNLTDLEC